MNWMLRNQKRVKQGLTERLYSDLFFIISCTWSFGLPIAVESCSVAAPIDTSNVGRQKLKKEGNVNRKILLAVLYNPNNTSTGSFDPKIIRSGFSNISLTFTKKLTDSFPSMIL